MSTFAVSKADNVSHLVDQNKKIYVLKGGFQNEK